MHFDCSTSQHQRENINFSVSRIFLYTTPSCLRMKTFLLMCVLCERLKKKEKERTQLSLCRVSDCELVARANCKSFAREAAASSLMVDHH